VVVALVSVRGLFAVVVSAVDAELAILYGRQRLIEPEIWKWMYTRT
jgi:hypothetical protein